MTTCRSILYCLVASVVLSPERAAALKPEEVVVIVNANAKGSEALGKYYCLARNILPQRLVAIRTTAGAVVGRKEYNENIRDPLRRFLAQGELRGRIKCVVLMWGVPVRVLGTKLTPEQRKLISTYKSINKRLHGRLAVNVKLLETVAVAFPQPRTKTLRPVGDLFDPGAAADLGKPHAFSSLKKTLAAELKKKQAGAAALTDKTKRRIALRQISALRLDTYGLMGLLKNMPAESLVSTAEKDQLKQETASAQAELARLKGLKETPETASEIAELKARLGGIGSTYTYCQVRIKAIDTALEDASVDSELALLWDQTGSLRGARPNPAYWRLVHARTSPATAPAGIIMTARIDGPTARDALRIIKDSIETEKTGLKGTFYIDAGGKFPPYDKYLTKLAGIIKKRTTIPVVLDTEKQLFAPGSCPDAALYIGWYSLRKYIPAFKWVRGAVGWHVASFEAQHLRAPASDEWCVKMIQNGVAATLGAVNEPYLHAFPLPQDFFCLLLTGQLTVAECYWQTVPSVSWRLTLIADPLYNPFKLHPKVSIYALPPALVGRPTVKPPTRPAAKPVKQ